MWPTDKQIHSHGLFCIQAETTNAKNCEKVLQFHRARQEIEEMLQKAWADKNLIVIKKIVWAFKILASVWT